VGCRRNRPLPSTEGGTPSCWCPSFSSSKSFSLRVRRPSLPARPNLKILILVPPITPALQVQRDHPSFPDMRFAYEADIKVTHPVSKRKRSRRRGIAEMEALISRLRISFAGDTCPGCLLSFPVPNRKKQEGKTINLTIIALQSLNGELCPAIDTTSLHPSQTSCPYSPPLVSNWIHMYFDNVNANSTPPNGPLRH